MPVAAVFDTLGCIPCQEKEVKSIEVILSGEWGVELARFAFSVVAFDTTAGLKRRVWWLSWRIENRQEEYQTNATPTGMVSLPGFLILLLLDLACRFIFALTIDGAVMEIYRRIADSVGYSGWLATVPSGG